MGGKRHGGQKTRRQTTGGGGGQKTEGGANLRPEEKDRGAKDRGAKDIEPGVHQRNAKELCYIIAKCEILVICHLYMDGVQIVI